MAVADARDDGTIFDIFDRRAVVAIEKNLIAENRFAQLHVAEDAATCCATDPLGVFYLQAQCFADTAERLRLFECKIVQFTNPVGEQLACLKTPQTIFDLSAQFSKRWIFCYFNRFQFNQVIPQFRLYRLRYLAFVQCPQNKVIVGIEDTGSHRAKFTTSRCRYYVFGMFLRELGERLTGFNSIPENHQLRLRVHRTPLVANLQQDVARVALFFIRCCGFISFIGIADILLGDNDCRVIDQVTRDQLNVADIDVFFRQILQLVLFVAQTYGLVVHLNLTGKRILGERKVGKVAALIENSCVLPELPVRQKSRIDDA